MALRDQAVSYLKGKGYKLTNENVNRMVSYLEADQAREAPKWVREHGGLTAELERATSDDPNKAPSAEEARGAFRKRNAREDANKPAPKVEFVRSNPKPDLPGADKGLTPKSDRTTRARVHSKSYAGEPPIPRGTSAADKIDGDATNKTQTGTTAPTPVAGTDAKKPSWIEEQLALAQQAGAGHTAPDLRALDTATTPRPVAGAPVSGPGPASTASPVPDTGPILPPEMMPPGAGGPPSAPSGPGGGGSQELLSSVMGYLGDPAGIGGPQAAPTGPSAPPGASTQMPSAPTPPVPPSVGVGPMASPVPGAASPEENAILAALHNPRVGGPPPSTPTPTLPPQQEGLPAPLPPEGLPVPTSPVAPTNVTGPQWAPTVGPSAGPSSMPQMGRGVGNPSAYDDQVLMQVLQQLMQQQTQGRQRAGMGG